LELHADEWKRRQDVETSRLRGLAIALLMPHLKEEARLSIEDALPRFSKPDKDQVEADERAEGIAVMEMWLAFKSAGKLKVKHGRA
jgi:hypothetical protein